MDETNGTRALASNDQWVAWLFITGPADTTLDLFLLIILEILGSQNGLGFLEFLLIEFFCAHL